MRRANAPSASASAAEPSAAVERAQPAGGLEQGGGLQLAALQVALDGDVRRVRVLALQQLAAASAELACDSARSCAGSLVARELGERAREQQVAGRHGDVAPGRGGDRRVAAAQLRAVDQIVVDERRRVDQLDRHGRAHEALLAVGAGGRPPGRLGGEHDQQRAQALAAGRDVAFACQASGAPAPRGDALEVALRARHRARAARRRRGA